MAYEADPLLDVAPRRAPIPPGHTIVPGLTIDGVAAALVVPDDDAPRYRRTADNARQALADRRRLSAIIDDPERATERAEILARVNAPVHARLAARSAPIGA